MMLSIIMLNDIVLVKTMLGVVMLNVVAPRNEPTTSTLF
jgi:hypothetical protein